MSDPAERQATSPVEILRRWEQGGAVWRVVSRTDTRLEVALMTCTAAETVERINSADPELLAFVGDRSSSED